MQKYTDVVLSNSGTPIGGATITVTNYPAATPATIYASDGGTAVGSVTTDPTGRFAFYAADGHYSITISGAGLVSQTIDDVVLNDPSNDATSANLAGTGGAALVGTSDGSTVQAKLTANSNAISSNTSAIAGKVNTSDLAAAGGAGMVGNTPAGNITSTTAQAALNELDSKKVASTALAATGGAALVGASDGRTVQANLSRANQAQSGNFYSDTGGIIQRMADRLFVGDGVQHDGKATPVTATWVKTVSSGIYEYLESNATALLPSMKGIGAFSAARSSTGGGTANDAAIGVAGFAYNDYVGGLGGVWGLYSTVLRKSGVNGATHGLEVDVGNLGTTVAIYPNAMFPSGLTDALWVCTGGETTNNTAVGTASCAIGIVQNDSQTTKTAKFDKGIVFHSQAIAGTDGATGTGIAMAFAKGHQQVWFNNSNQAIGEIVCTNGTVGSATRLDFTDYGTIFKDRASDGALFQIQNVANSANYLTAVGAVSGGGTVQLNANGADANLDIYIQPKGTGNVRFGAYTAGAVTQAGYITIKDNGGVVRRLLVG